MALIKSIKSFFSNFNDSWKSIKHPTSIISANMLFRSLMVKTLLDDVKDHQEEAFRNKFLGCLLKEHETQPGYKETLGINLLNVMSYPYAILRGTRVFLFKGIDHLENWVTGKAQQTPSGTTAIILKSILAAAFIIPEFKLA